MSSAPGTLPEFHPQTVLRDWGNGNAFRLSDALTGVCVFGATGSGKTSGPAKHLAYGYLAADFGGLVLCAKKEERLQWQKWASDCGRADDLVIVDSTGKWRFNFLEWEASRPDASGGVTINIVAILDEIAGAIAKAAGRDETGGGSNKFWEDALHHMNTNLVDLPVFAGLRVSLPLMRSIVNSAPQNLAQIEDERWQEASACANILKEAEKATAKASDDIRSDFEECRNYWLQEYPVLTNLTRPAKRVVRFYNQRGTAEQWIKEGKNTVKWTRLSCHDFTDNQVRLHLFVLAYNLGNFLRQVVLPQSVRHWTLTTLREKLIKIGAKVVRHSRKIVFQMAEVAVPRALFQTILERIGRLRSPAAATG